jgi:hypothetical protein
MIGRKRMTDVGHRIRSIEIQVDSIMWVANLCIFALFLLVTSIIRRI